MKKQEGISFSIRLKVVLAVVICAIGITVAVVFVSSKILMSSYLRIEYDETLRNIGRAEDALKNMVDQLDVKLVDWAYWDDTHAFVQDKNQAYLDSNLGIGSIANLKINGMVFLDAEGEVVFIRMIDFKTQQELPVENIVKYLDAHPELRRHNSVSSTVTGLIDLPEGPALLASEPILTSDGEGPINGSLMFIKFLSADEIETLGSLTHLDIAIFPYSNSLLPADVSSAKAELGESRLSVVQTISDDVVAGYGLVHDLFEEHILIIRIETNRPIYQQGRETFIIYGLMMGAVTPLFGLLVLLLLQNLLFSRLGRLNIEVGKIKEAGGLIRVTEGAADELGVLEIAINNMLLKISESQLDLGKFKLAVENASEHVIITDPAGSVIYANKSAEIITGYKLSEMIGHTPSLWGGEMPASFYKKMWKTISKDKLTFRGEVTNRRKNGERYVASVSISPILDDEDRVKFFVGLEQDITSQRQAEKDREEYAINLKAAKDQVDAEVKEKTKELNEERARFLASVNSLQIGFAIIDQNGELLVSNPALPVILGAKSELKTLNEVSALLGQDAILPSKLEECTRTHCTAEIGEIMVGKRYIRVSLTPVFVNDGKNAVGGVMLLEDITEAKNIDRTKSEFVSLASHQLRTPLSTINWYLEMLLSGDAGRITKGQKTFLNEIAVGNRRMVALVNALLNVSRLELGHLTVVAEPSDFTALVKEVIDSAHEKIVQREIKVINSSEEVKDIPLDTKYGRMVLENVFNNALKYTGPGGIVNVTLKKLKKGDEFGGRTMVEPSAGVAISDTGYGIPEEQQKKVFTKLFRADNVLDKDEEGTGLGLYIVKAILDQSGGEIWFESKENVGTTFYITLPLTGMKSQVGDKTLV